MAAETPHPLTPFGDERQANQLCKRCPFCSFGFVLPKMALYLLDCIERAFHLASDLPASSGTLEDHVALCERGQKAAQDAA